MKPLRNPCFRIGTPNSGQLITQEFIPRGRTPPFVRCRLEVAASVLPRGVRRGAWQFLCLLTICWLIDYIALGQDAQPKKADPAPAAATADAGTPAKAEATPVGATQQAAAAGTNQDTT